MNMKSSDPTNNLLFAYLALQNGLLERDYFVLAVNEWLQDKSEPITAIVQQRGWLDEQACTVIDQLMEVHLRSHNGDVEESIVAIKAALPADPEIEHLSLQIISGDGRTVLPDSRRGPPQGGDEPVQQVTMPPSDSPSGSDRPSSAKMEQHYPTLHTERESVFGRFQILRPHAKGGLGQVLVAHDSELNREVAVKELLERHAENVDLMARFRTEAQITGLLEHPGVVPVYSAGDYPNGSPYYVMRFIRGQELEKEIRDFHDEHAGNAYVGSRRIELIKLLRRFTDVCNAIGYSHSRGIIHRDIKPSNVMLGKFGETFVVDWGLAKKMSDIIKNRDLHEPHIEPASGSGSNPTTMGSTVGTPAFMPPEQAEGRLDELGATSDVYSLGATLYYLLTRKAPMSGGNVSEILEKVRKGDIPPPREVNPYTPPALQAICLQAMALAPEDRYQTPQQLADDIEKWIADEPVSVYQESFSQRFGRWLRRHRSWALATATSLIVIAVISAVAAIFINEARNDEARQRELAENSERKAVTARALAEKNRLEALESFRQAQNAVDTSMTGISSVLKHYPGVQHMRQALLEEVASHYEKFASQKGDDPEIQLERGRAYLRLGDVRRTLGDLAEAETAYQLAQNVFTGLLDGGDPPAAATHELAAARIKLAVLHHDLEDVTQSIALFQQAIDQLRKLIEISPQDAELRELLAMALGNSAGLHVDLARLTEARLLADEAIKIFLGLQLAHRDDTELAINLANVLNLSGIVYQNVGRINDAVSSFQAGIRQFDHVLQSKSEDPDLLQARGDLLISLATAHRELGDIKAEAASYNEALRSYELLVVVLPDIPAYQERQALTLVDLGQLQFEQNDLLAAEETLILALKIYQLLDEQHDEPRFLEGRASCALVLGRCYLRRGQLADASQFIDFATDRFAYLAEQFENVSYRERLAISRRYLAEVSLADGDGDAALALLNDSLARCQELIKLDNVNPRFRVHQAAMLARKGELLSTIDEADSALECWQQANQDLETALQQSSTPDRKFQLAQLIIHHPQLQNAETLARAGALAQQAVDRTPTNARYQNILAHALLLLDDVEGAQQALQQAQQFREQPYGLDHIVAALIARSEGNDDQATSSTAAAYSWFKKNQPGNAHIQWVLDQMLPIMP